MYVHDKVFVYDTFNIKLEKKFKYVLLYIIKCKMLVIKLSSWFTRDLFSINSDHREIII